MPDEQTIAALRTLSELKRSGVIPTSRPCCGQDYCICEHAPALHSLRDHAEDPDAYDRATGAPVRLHVVTAGPPPGPPCDGSMTCPCQPCAFERSRRPALGAGSAQFRVRAPRAMRDAA